MPTPVDRIHEAEDDYAKAKPAGAAVETALSPVLGGEPAVVVGTGVGVVIAALALTGVVDVETAVGVVTAVAPVVGGFITRFFVKPVVKV